ncbi:unnamed protein product, partial [Ectocarpus sp. 12 AP-2014]
APTERGALIGRWRYVMIPSPPPPPSPPQRSIVAASGKNALGVSSRRLSSAASGRQQQSGSRVWYIATTCTQQRTSHVCEGPLQGVKTNQPIVYFPSRAICPRITRDMR